WMPRRAKPSRPCARRRSPLPEPAAAFPWAACCMRRNAAASRPGPWTCVIQATRRDHGIEWSGTAPMPST
ncbi:MAG: COG1355, Predicted dioxygenase, partial [Olavius algarvensis Gamma 1 endosymbiont]